MRLIFIVFIPISVLLFCVNCSRRETKPEQAKEDLATSDSIYYKVFFQDNYYGYDVYQGSRKLIHQPTIPGREGNIGFEREKQATASASLVVQKLKQGIMPPTIYPAELVEILTK